jgi:DNA-3-methyladenine glycosylase II
VKVASADPTELEVALPPPLDLRSSLRPFGRWGDDGLDRWDGESLVRTAVLDDGLVVPYAARVEGSVHTPSLHVAIPHAAEARAGEIVNAIRATFVAVPVGLADLAAADERVARLVDRYPGLVPALVPDPFTALIRSISAQQVNLRWAATVGRRLAEKYGTRHEVGREHVYSIDAWGFAPATVVELRVIQLTTAKAKSVIAVAEAGRAGELGRKDLAALDDDALIAHMTRLRGIGLWSAEWFLARTLGRPRVVAGDLGVRKAVGRLYDAGPLPVEEEVRRLTAHWGASATVVQALALQDLASAASAASAAGDT